MKIRKYQPLLEVLTAAVAFYILHKLLFDFIPSFPETSQFYYQLEFLYGFFCICSLLIIFILIKVKSKNIDVVGNTFMALTCFKILISYLILRPILNLPLEIAKIEKINFFVIFALFLATETIATIRLLNKKE